MKNILFNFCLIIAHLASSKNSWLGTYEPRIPESLKNSR